MSSCHFPFYFSGKPLSLALASLFVPSLALGAPTGGVVTTGTAAIVQSGNVTNVNQSTQKATINWQGFSIAANETVNFNQPNVSSLTLNRVIGNEKSVIEGALNATGKVFLINSNGVLFAKGSSVNTGGLVASTLNITDEDFNAGNYQFTGNSSASVINLGTIKVTDGGYVALLGNNVTNEGVITATKGTVAMSAGDKITLNFNGDSLVSVSIDEGSLNALVANKQAIYADGGKVIMTGKAADELLGAQVNNTGIVQAQTIGDLTGSIQLYAYGGTANVDGTLDASAPNGGNGGSIETSGEKVKIADTANVTTKAANGTTGTWLVDPDGFTIAASGGDMTGTAVSNALASNNFTIASTSGSGSDGSINVNDAISWSANTTLTLTATNDININNAITASGSSAGVALNYGGDYNIRTKASYSGTTTDSSGNLVAQTDTSGGVYGSINFTACVDTASCANAKLKINNADYMLIGSMSQWDSLDGYNAATSTGTATAVTGNYALAHNLNASGTTYSTALISNFSGTLTGLGHAVDGLTISTADSNVGLIGQAASGSTTVLRDIGITNFSLNATALGSYYGALLGASNSTYLSVKNSYSTGSIDAYEGYDVGGLIGATSNTGYSRISSSYSDTDIHAYKYVGGLLGYAGGSSDAAGYYTTIINSDARGDITGKSQWGNNGWYLGGLVGIFKGHGSVTNSYATGNITSHVVVANSTQYLGSQIGGLIGGIGDIDDSGTTNFTTPISNSFATGNVTGGYYVGGLIGYIRGSSTARIVVDNVYAKGHVYANSSTAGALKITGAGGLIGWADYTDISNAYAEGNVSSTMTEGTTAGVTGASYVGGLLGGTESSATISNSYTSGNVTAALNSDVGGLAGKATTVLNSYAKGKVIGGSRVGGLAGNGTTIVNSYAIGDVTGTGYVGGLVGTISSGTVSGSYATGNVTASLDYVGGLVGYGVSGRISDSYATGSVSGRDYVGSLAGTIKYVSNSWTIGSVTGRTYTGALVGQLYSSGSVTNSYWNTDKGSTNNAVGRLGSSTSVDAKGLSDTAAADIAYYANGTINQVLAARAAYQEHVSDAAISASSVTSAAQQELTTPVTFLPTSFADAGPSIASRISLSDSLNFFADIKSITVDGVRFDLSDTAGSGASSGSGAAARDEQRRQGE